MSKKIGVPLELPWTDDLTIRAKHVKLTQHGAEIDYQLPFSKHRTVLRPMQIEHDYANRDKTPRQEIVRQGKWECGAAAIAMCTGHSMFHVKRALGRAGWRNDNRGLGFGPSRRAAQDLGFDLIWLPKKQLYMLDEVPTAILSVPSLNYSGRTHAVSWVDGEILDPNHGFAGRKTYGPEWHPHTIGAKGAEVLLKPVSKIQYEDLISMMINGDEDLEDAILECAA